MIAAYLDRADKAQDVVPGLGVGRHKGQIGRLAERELSRLSQGAVQLEEQTGQLGGVALPQRLPRRSLGLRKQLVVRGQVLALRQEVAQLDLVDLSGLANQRQSPLLDPVFRIQVSEQQEGTRSRWGILR